MVEYLYNAVVAVAGQDITISAKVTDNDNNTINQGCALILHFNNEEYSASGTYYEDINSWCFTIPADVTKGLNGRYFYSIQHNGANLCFKEPIYLV